MNILFAKLQQYASSRTIVAVRWTQILHLIRLKVHPILSFSFGYSAGHLGRPTEHGWLGDANVSPFIQYWYHGQQSVHHSTEPSLIWRMLIIYFHRLKKSYLTVVLVIWIHAGLISLKLNAGKCLTIRLLLLYFRLCTSNRGIISSGWSIFPIYHSKNIMRWMRPRCWYIWYIYWICWFRQLIRVPMVN